MTSADIKGSIAAALASDQRSAAHRARDRYRHPLETLEFFGFSPDSTVLELWPAAGYYAEILAPVLAKRGKLILARLDPQSPSAPPSSIDERVRKEHQLFGAVQLHTIDPNAVSLGPDESVDLVLNFRNYHGWIRRGLETKLVAAAFRVLKRGGVFGLEEHRGREGDDDQRIEKTGYVPEQRIISTLQAAGFQLAGSSDINANPLDTRDHPKGVWNLPPALRGEGQNQEKYLAIGESDRATLKFVKP